MEALEVTDKTVLEIIEAISEMPEPYNEARFWRVEYGGCGTHEVFIVCESD